MNSASVLAHSTVAAPWLPLALALTLLGLTANPCADPWRFCAADPLARAVGQALSVLFFVALASASMVMALTHPENFVFALG